MQPEFWHQRWARDEIGFHESSANTLLQRHFDALSLPPGSVVFLPLCGKTLDIGWLADRGHPVVGAELSERAVEQLFAERGLTPSVTDLGHVRRFRADRITVYAGDLFALERDDVGPVSAVYDRAALVALPPEMRGRYAARVVAITAGAPQLLVCFEYDQQRMEGPPFSVDAGEVHALYGDVYAARSLEARQFPGGLKGQCPAIERIWHLVPAGAD